MVKPRGSRRKGAVVLSDEEEDEVPIRTSPPKRQRSSRSQTLQSQNQTAGGRISKSRPTRQIETPDSTNPQPPTSTPRSTKSPSNSPQKRAGKAATQPVAKEKAIYSFFNKQTQKQKQSSLPPVSSGPQIPTKVEDIEEDFIQDDSLDEEEAIASVQNAGSITALAVRKRSRDVLGTTAKSEHEFTSSATQKFLRTEKGRVPRSDTMATKTPKDVDTRPWMDRFDPRNLDELAVHKKKVADVQAWIQNVFNGSYRKRLLILKGPAGSAKTTTINLLSKELGFSIQEWRNPSSSFQSTEGSVSMAAQFEDFMSRTGKFRGLEVADSTGRLQQDHSETSDSGKQIILIEDFPNTITNASSALSSFRSVILQFLASNTPSMGAFFGDQASAGGDITPVIMIISETLLSSASGSTDSFTAHRVLGQEILNHPGATLIEFNPIAPTILTKALELVVVKESRISGRRKTPGPQVIKHLSEIGDVRSAVSSLEFMCLRGDDQEGWGNRVAFSKPKRGVRDIPLTKMEQESLQIITQRENTLGIFHSVGKVVYNKRLEPDQANPTPQPPNHLPQHRRPKASEVHVDTLLDELGTDIQIFVSALHENYALSCRASEDEDTMDALSECIEALSDADLLSPDRFSASAFARRSMQGTAADSLRQEETSFQVAVRGILFNLPHPVKRQAAPGNMPYRGGSNSRGDSHQMFYPTGLRLWRSREEMEGLLDLWVNKAQNGTLGTVSASSHTRRRQPTGGVDTWKRTNALFEDSSKSAGAVSTAKDDAHSPEGPALLAGGSSARHEMLLERLPYMAKICRGDGNPTSTKLAEQFEKVTTFSGIKAPTKEEPDEDETESQPKQDTKAPLLKSAKIKPVDTEELRDGHLAGLVLSDDDIEDD